MQTTSTASFPRRVSDLVQIKQSGAELTVATSFTVLPVDFQHRHNPFQAYIFLCHYSGEYDGRPFSFRKCYARGCPNNQCTHVSQAVIIANRYLQRDYRTLENAGVKTSGQLFTLEDMVLKFENLKETMPAPLAIEDLIDLYRAGKIERIGVILDYIPAVEHFAHHQNAQVFLSGEFVGETEDKRVPCHRCFSCYAAAEEAVEKPLAIRVANARLQLIYQAFGKAEIACDNLYFR